MRRNFEVPRQEFIDPVDGMISDACKDLAEVGLWFEAIQLCSLDQRQDCSGSSSALV